MKNSTLTALKGVKVGHAAARAVQESIYDACRSADTVEFEGAYQGKIPSVKDFQ